MRSLRILSITLLAVTSICCNAQNNIELKERIAKAEATLKQHPQNQNNWQQLYTLINENYVRLTATERERLRKLLEQYGKWSTGTIYTATEPGTKIIVKGRIVDVNGRPVANASLHIFQTDSRGYYTPLDSAEKKMGEPDARLFCFLRTDSNGNFEIHTIRPASYPIQYNGRTIPQHIHNNITAAGYTSKYLQMVFDDDPAMNDYWRKWASGNGFPILKLNNTSPRTATVEIVLTK